MLTKSNVNRIGKLKLMTGVIASAFVAGQASAAIIGFEAESGTLGAEYNTGADGTALGGSYIEHADDAFPLGADQPNTDAFTVSYNLNLAAGTYDVYVKMRFPSNGEDSFFIADEFGDADPAVAADWQKIENTVYPTSAINGSGGVNNFTWSNALPITLTAPGGPVTWEIGAREEGNDIDAFAFVTSGQSVTATELDNAVIPEPGSLALLGLGGLLIARRRRG